VNLDDRGLVPPHSHRYHSAFIVPPRRLPALWSRC
jgi:hypothetical protein